MRLSSLLLLNRRVNNPLDADVEIFCDSGYIPRTFPDPIPGAHPYDDAIRRRCGEKNFGQAGAFVVQDGAPYFPHRFPDPLPQDEFSKHRCRVQRPYANHNVYRYGIFFCQSSEYLQPINGFTNPDFNGNTPLLERIHSQSQILESSLLPEDKDLLFHRLPTAFLEIPGRKIPGPRKLHMFLNSFELTLTHEVRVVAGPTSLGNDFGGGSPDLAQPILFPTKLG